MYKNNIAMCQAWKRFLLLFKLHLLHFLFYGLFIFVLSFLITEGGTDKGGRFLKISSFNDAAQRVIF